jgi:hypothetical protein
MSDSPIYINLSVNTGINSDASANLNNQPSQIVFNNEDTITADPSQYYLSLNRALLNTSSVPAYIFPIKNGLTQTNINLSPFKISFEYYNASSLLIYTYITPIIFKSQILDKDPLPPSQNGGLQDFVTSPFYYYVYDIEWMLNIFNSNIKDAYETFCANLISYGISLDNTLYPFYTYNFNTRLFQLNFPVSLYDQNTYPQVLFYMDSVSADLFGCPSNIYTAEKETNYLMLCYDLYNNITQYNNIDYYFMTANQNQLNIWCPIKRILFTITDLPVRLEIESAFNNIQFEAQQNNSLNSINKPNLNTFFDLSVDQDQWAMNRNVVQYAVSSIAESRLVALGSGSYIRNFNINIFWTDTFGNYRPLLAYPNSQNNLKLALYSKRTMLL